MKRTLSIAFLVALVSGCSGQVAEPATTQPATVDEQEALEVAFLDEARRLLNEPDDLDEEEALEVGHFMCRELAAGRVDEDGVLSNGVQRYADRGYDGWLSAALLATDSLCPDWRKG